MLNRQAFKGDLDDLMKKAKEMVSLADKYTKKISGQKGKTSDDEYSKLEGYLQSMGLDNPVTRDKYKSGMPESLKIFMADLGQKTLTRKSCRDSLQSFLLSLSLPLTET